jgi:hypothetical protein
MTETREKIEHPSWCDRSLCTAPEFRPTKDEYAVAGAVGMGSHQSAPLSAYSGRDDLEMSLWQGVCPWDTDVMLVLRLGGQDLGTLPISPEGGGFGLFEMLGQAIGDLTRAYPTLYGERFGWVPGATSSGEAPAETQDVVAAAESPFDAEPEPLNVDGLPPLTQAALRAMEGRPTPEIQDAGRVADEDTRYQVTVNNAATAHGTFREIRAAVAGLVTGWLAEDPEGLALDAQTLNMAFNTGSVQDAVHERGEWYTMFGVHSEHATMRIRVTREA